MLQGLRAKRLKGSETDANNVFTLTKNNPRQIDKDNNEHIGRICEESVNEELFIHSVFTGNAFAMIGRKFCLNLMNDPRRVDFSYYYFSEDKKARVYLYDMKQTLAGNDVILHLIGQWQESIKQALACMCILDDYELSEIYIGVITENNDCERRKREIMPLTEPNDISPNISSFQRLKYKAAHSGDIAKAKVLKEFLNGTVTLSGNTYSYDVREFVNKRHDMYFNNGILARDREGFT